ncbi:hypothetical protein [Streptomyces sp. NPDC048659]|uniref:hypothetical protein n=1 Tax=Streptomyces sp. NPDC048659 TaxID=3155489 RepID=UPI00342946AF
MDDASDAPSGLRAARRTRARDRAARRRTLLDLLNRIDRLTPTEVLLLVEHTRAELAAADALRSSLIGVERALQQRDDQLVAAEAAIVETEHDRDDQAEQRRRLGIELRHWQTHIVPMLAGERDQALAATARALAVRRAPGRLPWSLPARAQATGWDAALDAIREAIVVRTPGARPVHPDGTPYGYADIVAEGWSYCDACRQWGRDGTPDIPHDCPAPLNCATTKEPR